MMSNIYNIGVYRALGATKKNIYIDYLLDAIYLATFTVLAGFMLMLLFVNYASKYMPGLAISTTTVLIVIPAIYFFVILASLLPIYLLLRKTPIEILAKYDI
jgi:ABC-type antimicrobial peptide transport system permease subunit